MLLSFSPFIQSCLQLLFLLNILHSATSKGIVSCPSKCPSCTKCDPWKGQCLLPRDFVNCTTTTGKSGLCYAGTCLTNLNLVPNFKTLNFCQTYNCNATGTCQFANKTDGTDCTQPSQIGLKMPYICTKGQCKQIILGLSDLPPWRNIGCIGMPDNTPCDTNDVVGDGEVCLQGLCKFPDGTAYGLLPN